MQGRRNVKSLFGHDLSGTGIQNTFRNTSMGTDNVKLKGCQGKQRGASFPKHALWPSGFALSWLQ